MLNVAAKSKEINTSNNDAEGLKQTPRKQEEAASSTPRLANKTPTSPRAKTGKARELELAFIDASLRDTPVPLGGPSSDAQGTSDQRADLPADKTPIVKGIRKNEAAAFKSPAITSPYRNPLPDPSRPAPLPPRKVPPLQIPATVTDMPPATPVKVSSPRKVTQLISEKIASAKKTAEILGSPRNDVTEIFEDMEWQEFSEIGTNRAPKNPQPPLSRAPMTEPSLKRKSESDIERDKKKVRFNDDVSTKTFVKPHPEPAREHTSSTSLAAEFDRLNRELALSPVQSQHTGDADAGLMPASGQDLRLLAQSPMHSNLPKATAQGALPRAASDKTAFPLPLTKLAKHAIEARRQHKAWIGKATGDAIAGRLQATLEKLLKANSRKIDLSVYLCLQQLFGLLPAGATEEDKTLRYVLEQSVLNLGLNVDEWEGIAQLHQHFDELDVHDFAEDGAEFRKQLGKIIETKNKLLAGKEAVREKSGKGSDA